MSKLRSVLVGTALAGALAAGIAAAPAQAATASTSSMASVASVAQAQAQSGRHYFEGYSDFGRGESRRERSYYKGYWYFSNGRYYFDINTFDRDRDSQNTYVDFWYHDNRGWHQGHRFSTRGHHEWKFSYSARGGFDGFRVRIGEGNSHDFDWNNYYRHSF